MTDLINLPEVPVPPGVFWADFLATLKDYPMQRLSVAIKHLPLPAAFREAATAIRALIRERRKTKEPYADLLAFLYTLAAQHSLLLDTPYIDGIGPGFNVAESISHDCWAALPMPYEDTGHSKL